MPGIYQKQFQDEDAAREFLEKLFWPEGSVCPKCGVVGDATKLERKEGTKSHGRKGLYQCNSVGCREQFTVTIGTIFEDSHIALHKWLLAIYLMCSSKKGISALQLQRNLEIGSYRTAWFMAHRIRWAMTQGPMTELLKGIVEVDETYVGGKEIGKGHTGANNPAGNKTAVLALLERGGNVRSFPLERATLKNIGPILEQHIDPSSHLVTDESAIYYTVRDKFASHRPISHRSKKYVRREADMVVTTNTIESYFALLKRANYGIHHHMSRKYLGSYCAERDFVYNGRNLTDDERTVKAIKATEGKRLMLKEPKGAE
jgi:hypothetical protein